MYGKYRNTQGWNTTKKSHKYSSHHLTTISDRKPYLPVKVELKDARAYLGLVIISAQTDRHFTSKHSDS